MIVSLYDHCQETYIIVFNRLKYHGNVVKPEQVGKLLKLAMHCLTVMSNFCKNNPDIVKAVVTRQNVFTATGYSNSSMKNNWWNPINYKVITKE